MIAVESCTIDGKPMKFQRCYATKRGEDVVLYTLGNPTYDDGAEVQVGDKMPFLGYTLNFDKIIILNDMNIDIDSHNDVRIIFKDGSEFNGCSEASYPGSCFQNNKFKIYENLSIFVGVKDEMG